MICKRAPQDAPQALAGLAVAGENVVPDTVFPAAVQYLLNRPQIQQASKSATNTTF